MSYDKFAETFSKSRIEHPWPELDYLIDIMCQNGTTTILDVGCGNGRFIEHYESRVTNHELQYLGIDSSTGMIREARRLHPGYEFEVSDMTTLSTIPLSHYPTIPLFDCILLLASFHHLETREERLQVLQNMKSYLAPGGEIMMTNWNLRDQPRYEKSHQ
jgi:tRNA (uracil-5-)-methyltransferase TRM9